MVSINILVEGIFQHLTPEQRKLLMFCDNRQDTAFQAAYLNQKHTQFISRQIIYQVLCEERATEQGSASLEKLLKPDLPEAGAVLRLLSQAHAPAGR